MGLFGVSNSEILDAVKAASLNSANWNVFLNNKIDNVLKAINELPDQDNTPVLTEILAKLDAIQAWQVKVDTSLQFLTFVCRIPKKPSISVVGETPMGLKFEVLLPALSEQLDIVGGELTVTIGDKSPIVLSLSTVTGSVTSDEFVGADNEIVTLELRYVDDAGNFSSPSPATQVTLLDTIAPPAPGMPGLVVVGEVFDSTTPEPVVTTVEPIVTTEEPIVTTEAPVVTTEAPVATTEEPSVTEEP